MAGPPPLKDIGTPDFYWGQWGQGLLTDWWETTADLIWPQSVITYGRMRHDPQLKAVLQAYVLPILRATWLIDGEGCRDEVTQQCADDLGVGVLGQDNKIGPARRRGVIWERHLRSALPMQLTYGHGPFERRYREEDSRLRLDNLGPRMPWTIARIMLNKDATVDHIVQTTQPDPIPASRLVWYVNELEGANWAGISMLRPAFGAWLLKNEAIRVHATSIRRFGMGVPTVTAPAGGTAQMVTQAQMLASAMRAGDQAGMGLPAGFTAALTGLSGSTPDAMGFITYCDHQMAKMALAQMLDLGTTKTGSRAVGESFMDLFLLSLQSVADEMAVTATSGHDGMPGILTDLVDQNWGEDEPCPRITCSHVGDNYEATAAALQQLVASGALNPDPSLDEWVRDRWHLPKRVTPWQPGLPPKTTVRESVGPNGEPVEPKTGPTDPGGNAGPSAPATPPAGAPAASADPPGVSGTRGQPAEAKYNPAQPRDDHGKWTHGDGGTGGGHHNQSKFYNDVPETRGPGRSKGQFNGPTGRDLADRSKSGQVAHVAEPITAKEARGNSRPVTDAEFQALARKGVNQLGRLRAMRSPITGLHQHWPELKKQAWAETRKPWGGMTIDSHTGQVLPQGADKYALSVKKADMLSVSIPENASQQQLNQAMDDALTRFAGPLAAAQSHLGVFHDDAEHRIDIDPVLVVDTPAEVEAIGAYTHAVGGAYHFATGNGYFPPHVADTTKAAAGDDDVHFAGPGEWHRQAEENQPGLTPEQETEIEEAAGTQAAFNPEEKRDYHGRWGTGGPLKVEGEFSLPPGHPLRAKMDAQLAKEQAHKTKKGTFTRPPLPRYEESVNKVTAHITSLIDAHHTLNDGIAWYPAEHEKAVARAKKYNVSLEMAAGVESATSPRTSYAMNQKVTDDILAKAPHMDPAEAMRQAKTGQLGSGIMGQFRQDGVAIATGGDLNKALGGPKRRPFFNNIMYPGATNDVTIDTWMNQALQGLGLDKLQASSLAAEQVKGLAAGVGQVVVADATRKAAQQYGVSPDAVQAAYWIAAQQQAGNLNSGARSKGGHGAGDKLTASAMLSTSQMTDDEYDAELLIEFLQNLPKIPKGTPLRAPASAKSDDSLAASNPDAWQLAQADPRWAKLGLTLKQAQAKLAGATVTAKFSPTQLRDKYGRWSRTGGGPPKDSVAKYKQPDGAWTPERAALHQKIIDQVLAGHKGGEAHPVATFLGGGPGAGKSSALPPVKGAAVIEADKIKTMLPDYQQQVKAGNPDAAVYVHHESTAVSWDAEHQALARKISYVMDGTGNSSYAGLKQTMDEAHTAGFQVNAKYVTVSTETALARAADRLAKTGRGVPAPVIKDIHAHVSAVFPQAVADGLFDHVELYDNNGPMGSPAKLIAHGSGTKLTVTDPAAYEAFLAKGAGVTP